MLSGELAAVTHTAGVFFLAEKRITSHEGVAQVAKAVAPKQCRALYTAFLGFLVFSSGPFGQLLRCCCRSVVALPGIYGTKRLRANVKTFFFFVFHNYRRTDENGCDSHLEMGPSC